VAPRLARYFGTPPDFWLSLRKTYELDLARARLGAAIERLPQRAGGTPAQAARHP
jgi:plasmid maintenance system antidote protein VapI